MENYEKLWKIIEKLKMEDFGARGGQVQILFKFY